MPSIPQSLLWISLVVLWLFVLVPMLVSKRDAVRRTSDVALATRVVNSDTAARLIKRGGPAAGHRSDPDWQPDEDEHDDLDELDSDDAEDAPPSRVVVTVAAAVSVEETGPDYLDVDVVDPDSAALPAGTSAAETPLAADDGSADDVDTQAYLALEDDDDDGGFEDDDADQYEYVDDTSGIAVGEELPRTVTPAFSRRHRYDADTAAAVEARKYAFRRRVLTIMAMTLVASSGAAFQRDFFGVVVRRHDLHSDRALPGLPTQANSNRSQRVAAPDAPDGAVASRRGKHLRPREIRRHPLRLRGGSAPWCWRSTTRIRSSNNSTMRPTLASTPGTGTCRELPGSNGS